MIGLDTSFLIDFFNGEEKSVLWMTKYKELVCLNEQVIYEFLCGKLNSNQIDKFLSFVSQLPIFSFNRIASLRSAEIYRFCKRRGLTVPHPDTMIAGTYISNNVSRIVTKNVRDFKKISELNVMTY